MTKHCWSGKHWHPTERDLLLFVNGEGGTKLARKVRAHVEGCWSCSMKRDRLAGAIAAFMRSRESVLDGEELSEAAERRFVSRLRRAADQAKSDALKRKAPKRSFPDTRVQVVLAVCLLVTITALVWLRFTSVPTVSAREVLSRAEDAETNRIGAVNNPVVHQVLEVTRRGAGLPSESAYLEFWRDARHDRWKQQTNDAGVSGAATAHAKTRSGKSGLASEHAVVVELQEILKSNDMRPDPMSASGFSNWRSKLRKPTESVTETVLGNGTNALTVITSPTEPLRQHAIAKAELVVRQQDWHPVEQRLSVWEPNGPRSYEIREASFEVVTLGSLPSSIFDQLPVPAPLVMQNPSVDRGSMTESTAEAMLELQIALLDRLHRAGACLLGEEIRVVAGPSGSPEVRGVVESLERKQLLTKLLSDFPNVPILLKATAEENQSGPIEDSAAEAPTVPKAGPVAAFHYAGSSGIKEYLSAYFARQDLTTEARHAKLVEFSNQVISQSQLADLHAWELKRLADHFAAARLERTSPRTLGLLRTMVENHLNQLLSSVSSCEEMLRPVLLSLGSGTAEKTANNESAVEPGTWQARCLRIFESVRKTDSLIFGLFAEGEEKAGLQDSSFALLTSLPRIASEIRSAESQLSTQLVSIPSPSKPVQQAKH